MQTSHDQALTAALRRSSTGGNVVSPVASVGNFAPDVLAYAEKNKLMPYLQPLLEATHRIFPNAEWVKVYYKPDPEVAGNAAIVYDVRVSDLQYPEAWTARKAWVAELCRICPAPYACDLVLLLDLAD